MLTDGDYGISMMLIWTLTFPVQCYPGVLTFFLHMGEIRTSFYAIITHQPQMMTGQWLSGFVQVDGQQGFEVARCVQILNYFNSLNIPSFKLLQ